MPSFHGGCDLLEFFNVSLPGTHLRTSSLDQPDSSSKLYFVVSVLSSFAISAQKGTKIDTTV